MKVNEVLVGRTIYASTIYPFNIVLIGAYIEAEHCIFRHKHAEVQLIPKEGARCSINSNRVHQATKLNQGQTHIVVGIFLFNSYYLLFLIIIAVYFFKLCIFIVYHASYKYIIYLYTISRFLYLLPHFSNILLYCNLCVPTG